MFHAAWMFRVNRSWPSGWLPGLELVLPVLLVLE
jgi:hypothetical protein